MKIKVTFTVESNSDNTDSVDQAIEELSDIDLDVLLRPMHLKYVIDSFDVEVLDPVIVDDYEACGYCGYDHSYEYEEANKWHIENDPDGDLYK